MEQKTTAFASALFTIFLVGGILHGVMHIGFYGTGVSGILKSGLSGYVVNSGDSGSWQQKSLGFKPYSHIVLLIEWVFVAGAFMVLVVRRHLEIQEEIATIDLSMYSRPPSSTRTDIDILHALLRDKKQLKLSVISKVFGVSRSMALDWARILENGRLAVVTYPHFFGEPSLLLPHSYGRNA